MNTILVLTIGLFLYSYICIFSPVASAQQTQRTITIVPPSINLTVNPGDRKEGILKVINDSNETLIFNAETQDFIVGDTQGTPDFLAKDTLGKPYSAAAWIGVVPDSFSIAPKQKVVLNYYVQIPSNARPGGHYAGVIYTPTTTLGAKATGPAVQTQIGSLFSIDVAGDIHEEGIVTKFLSEHGFYEYGPVNILTQVKNLGDLHIKPLGTITVYNMFGQKLAVLPLDEHNIFPQAARDFVNVYGRHWMFGPYTAKLAASYGRNGNLPLMASMTFWVFPWKITVVIILLIVAGVLGYFYWKRRKQNPPHEHHAEPAAPTPPTHQPEAK